MRPRTPFVLTSALMLLALARAAHAVTFNFTLTQPGKTSAGVFTPTGTLTKTLWSAVPFAPGAYATAYDRSRATSAGGARQSVSARAGSR